MPQCIPQSKAIAKGLTTEAAVDKALSRSLKQLFWAGVFDDPSNCEWAAIPAAAINSTAHQASVKDVGLQSMVLLRNEKDTLPLQAGLRIAVVGPQAAAKKGLLSDYASEEPCYDTSGDGGSCILSIVDEIRARNEASGKGVTTTAPGVDMNSKSIAGIPAALALAKEADVVVLAVGIDKSIEGEGIDRPNIRLPGQQELFAKLVLGLDKPTVLVLTNGGVLGIDVRELSLPAILLSAAPLPLFFPLFWILYCQSWCRGIVSF